MQTPTPALPDSSSHLSVPVHTPPSVPPVQPPTSVTLAVPSLVTASAPDPPMSDTPSAIPPVQAPTKSIQPPPQPRPIPTSVQTPTTIPSTHPSSRITSTATTTIAASTATPTTTSAEPPCVHHTATCQAMHPPAHIQQPPPAKMMSAPSSPPDTSTCLQRHTAESPRRNPRVLQHISEPHVARRPVMVKSDSLHQLGHPEESELPTQSERPKQSKQPHQLEQSVQPKQKLPIEQHPSVTTAHHSESLAVDVCPPSAPDASPGMTGLTSSNRSASSTLQISESNNAPNCTTEFQAPSPSPPSQVTAPNQSNDRDDSSREKPTSSSQQSHVRKKYSKASLLSLRHEAQGNSLLESTDSVFVSKSAYPSTLKQPQGLNPLSLTVSPDILLPSADAMLSFADLHLAPALLSALNAASFAKPTPIQLRAFPPARLGADLIAHSKSGTGKTLAFILILLDALLNPNSPDIPITSSPAMAISTISPSALILEPTRELAIQVNEVIQSLTNRLPPAQATHFHAISLVGGTPVRDDVRSLKSRPPRIIVGTPARVRAIAASSELSMHAISHFVLDEADRLLDPSFQDDLNFLAGVLPRDRQTIALSATIPPRLREWLTSIMRSPVYVSGIVSDGSTDKQAPNETIDAEANHNREAALAMVQQFKLVSMPQPSKSAPPNLSRRMAGKLRILRRLLIRNRSVFCVVFTGSRPDATAISTQLIADGTKARLLHGGLPQRERESVMNDVRQGTVCVLVATDLVARGLDVVSCDNVIMLDIPSDSSTYLHRVGRAGRYGGRGTSILVYDRAEHDALSGLERSLGFALSDLGESLGELTTLQSRNANQNSTENADDDVAQVSISDTPIHVGVVQSQADNMEVDKPPHSGRTAETEAEARIHVENGDTGMTKSRTSFEDKGNFEYGTTRTVDAVVSRNAMLPLRDVNFCELKEVGSTPEFQRESSPKEAGQLVEPTMSTPIRASPGILRKQSISRSKEPNLDTFAVNAPSISGQGNENNLSPPRLNVQNKKRIRFSDAGGSVAPKESASAVAAPEATREDESNSTTRTQSVRRPKRVRFSLESNTEHGEVQGPTPNSTKHSDVDFGQAEGLTNSVSGSTDISQEKDDVHTQDADVPAPGSVINSEKDTETLTDVYDSVGLRTSHAEEMDVDEWDLLAQAAYKDGYDEAYTLAYRMAKELQRRLHL